MSVSRLRRGEFVLVVALVALIASLFLQWFTVDRIESAPGADGSTGVALSEDTEHGWGILGHPWLEVLAVAGLAWIGVLLLAMRSGRGRSTYGAVIAVVVAIPTTAIVVVLTLIRTLLATPGFSLRDLGVGGFGNLDRLGDLDATVVHLSPGIGTWIGLAALLAGLVGLWVAMADDRTSAADSAMEPPPARRVPPPKPPVASDAEAAAEPPAG